MEGRATGGVIKVGLVEAVVGVRLQGGGSVGEV